VGDKVTIICPSDLAYGNRGAGEVIPPVTYILS
jgi:FKBP-type peptidyl-prolyl cis-trans isomerase